MRKHPKFQSIQVAALVLLVLSGCKKESVLPPVNVTPKSEAVDLLQPNMGAAVIPGNQEAGHADPFRSSSTHYVQGMKTWDEIMRSIPPDDARYLRKINANYFGAISFSSPEEKSYLKSSGFPLPEEWLTAKSMSDQELKGLSDSGGVKAKAFYLDRLIERASEYLDLRESDDVAYRNSLGAKYSLQAYELTAQIQAVNKSPFRGYLLGSAYSRLNYPASPEAGAAGMFVAYGSGDKRALNILSDYESKHPNMDISKILAAHNAMRSSP